MTTVGQPLAAKPTADPARITAEEDRLLVERCLLGDQSAWDELYRRCHCTLLSAARSVIGSRPDCVEISDEIAARAWLRLLADDYALLRSFDPTRGSPLPHYLGAICRNVGLNYCRSERRRRSREVTATQVDVLDPAISPGYLGSPPEEFVAMLTPRERQFCEGFLLTRTAEVQQLYQLSSSNIRQLKSRIERKLRRWLKRQ